MPCNIGRARRLSRSGNLLATQDPLFRDYLCSTLPGLADFPIKIVCRAFCTLSDVESHGNRGGVLDSAATPYSVRLTLKCYIKAVVLLRVMVDEPVRLAPPSPFFPYYFRRDPIAFAYIKVEEKKEGLRRSARSCKRCAKSPPSIARLLFAELPWRIEFAC